MLDCIGFSGYLKYIAAGGTDKLGLSVLNLHDIVYELSILK